MFARITRWLFAIIVLPGTALVLVPWALLSISRTLGNTTTHADPGEIQFLIGVAFAVIGLYLALWTMSLFFRFGKGTPAPWDPPSQLVIRGPYRHVRNPMILGVLLMLVAESLLFGSWFVAGWTAVFFLANLIYFPLVEEPGLEKRFRDDYATYCGNVGRWIPRLTPYRAPHETSSDS